MLRNARAGGFAALSYVARDVPADFALSAWLHVPPSDAKRAPLEGLAFRVDPGRERYYRFAAQFGAESTLSLAYVGRDERNFPVYLRKWRTSEIGAGLPAAAGWHRVRVVVVSNEAEVYWDEVKLPGGPFAVDRSRGSHAGVYATFTTGAGEAETRVAEFTVEKVVGRPSPPPHAGNPPVSEGARRSPHRKGH